MHELSLAHELVGLMERVAEENKAKQITRATVALGRLSCVEPEALKYAFEFTTKDTVAAGCELVLQSAPLVVRCRDCEFEGELEGEIDSGCPKCKGGSVEVVSGREMRLVSIDVED